MSNLCDQRRLHGLKHAQPRADISTRRSPSLSRFDHSSSIVQDDLQQRSIDVNAIVIVDEAEFAEAV